MSEVYTTIIFLFVLFGLLGGSVWIGLALMGVAWVGMVQLDAHRPAALYLDGRDPLSHPIIGGHVSRSRAVDALSARRAFAHQHRGLHDLCGGVGFLCRDAQYGG